LLNLALALFLVMKFWGAYEDFNNNPDEKRGALDSGMLEQGVCADLQRL
jgi:hypothetical protein